MANPNNQSDLIIENNKCGVSEDDQELFLKVLENLKNAVTKPDSHVALPKRPVTHGQETGLQSSTLTAGAEISVSESQTFVARSDIEEPGTTTVTVSDKTKSLILQKLASERAGPHDSVKILAHENSTPPPTPVHVQSQIDIKTDGSVVTTVPSFGVHTENNNGTQKSLYTARSLAYVKTATKASDKSEQTNQKQTSPSVQLYPCNYCDYYSDNKSYLKQHVDIVHISDRPFKCPYCEYAGKRSHALREHLIVHTDERPFQCSVCKATFRKKGHLTNHIKLHNSKRLVKCPLCKALVYDTGENGLDAHLKNDHDTERLYGCDLCDHIAASEPDIIKHLRKTHKTQIVSHKCEKCPYETANSVDFNAHLNAHKMADNEVNIGGNGPSKVLGVATFPTGSEQLGIPNTVVKMNSVEPNTTSKTKQPAVIKPVWIKCSECGFTGQDSEVIRNHMLEHLGLEAVKETAVPSQSHSNSKTGTSDVELKQIALQTPVKSESATNPSTPILVPVTDIDSLPRQTGKIDMNSPILVPVTDAGMLKRLQQSVAQQIASKSPIVTVASADQNVAKGKSAATATTASDILKQANRFNIQEEKKLNLTKASPTTAQPIYIIPNTSDIPVQTVVTLPSEKIEQIVQNPSFRVIPLPNMSNLQVVSSGSRMTFSSRPQGSVVTPSVTSAIVSSSEYANVAQSSTSLSTAGQSRAVPSITVTRIPIPRTDAPTSPPKLPPEIAKIASPMDEVASGIGKKTELTTPTIDTTGKPQDGKLSYLKDSLANVQNLIEQQEKLSRKVAAGTVMKIDAKDSGGKSVVFYVEPVSSQGVQGKSQSYVDLAQESGTGKFKCTLCGYICEHQRTIKAHIWKHSGNKDIDYPMFQNGPLSMYDEESLPTKVERNENMIEIVTPTSDLSKSVGTVPPLIKSISEIDASSGKMPPFIVYEQTKISNVAPALAHLIAARTMAGMTKLDGDSESTVSGNSVDQENVSESSTENSNIVIHEKEEEHKNKEIRPVSNIFVHVEKTGEASTVTERTIPQSVSRNVVVETVANVTSAGDYTGYTGLQSQQNSPRIATRSPDSCTEVILAAKNVEETSVIYEDLHSQAGNVDNWSSAISEFKHSRKREISQQSRNTGTEETDSSEMSASKKVKVLQAHEDSAVTLLSLLKKGPNYNPACPPTSVYATQPQAGEYSNVSSPGHEDSNSVGESEMSGSKPKSGISTSLLAVIEQLRERSKSDADDEKPILPPAKKTSKRRSRKSSQEDSTPASGIENVEEFSIDGEVKFRCKLCHYTNESTLLLRQHMRLHKPKQEFECSLCDLIAESSEALQDHMIQHCKVRTYQCKLCNSTFNYKSQLRAHMRMHNDQDILFCDYCDFETRNSVGMKLHTKSHLTKPPYKCDTCQEDFVSSHNLRIHKRDGCNTSIDKGSTSFKCDECDFVFFGRREMKNHLRLHMGRSKSHVTNRCPYCEHSDSSIENIQKHVSDVHGKWAPLKCDMCGFFAVSIRSLKSHMKRHVNDQRFVAQPLEQYKCNLCGYVCHHLPSLKSHMWRHAADQHYSYEFTNDVINAAIDFDGQTDVSETTTSHVEKFKALIFEKMKAKGLENTHGTLEESAVACCWVTFRCCQCGFETINKAELNMHMGEHSDVIKMTLEIGDQTVIINNQGNEVEVE